MTEKKKLYSKNGCRECKRRKIKCDEAKPQCRQCTRLDKVCSYPKAGEKVLRVSKKFLIENKDKLFAPEEKEQLENIKINDKRKYKRDIQARKLQDSKTQSPTSSFSSPSQIPVPTSNPNENIQDVNSNNTGHGPIPMNNSISPYPFMYQQQFSPEPTLQSHLQQQPQQHQQMQHLPQPSIPQPQPQHPAQFNNFTIQNRMTMPNPNMNNQYPMNLRIPSPIPGQPLTSPLGGPNYNFNRNSFFKTFHPLSSSGINKPISPQPQLNMLPQMSGMGPTSIPNQPPTPGFLSHGLGNFPSIQSPQPLSEVQNSTTSNTSPISKHSNSPNPQMVNSGLPNNPNIENPITANNLDYFDNYFNREDLNVLASDLNNLVGTIMFESNFEKTDDFEIASLESNSTIRGAPSLTSASRTNNTSVTSPSIPIMSSMYSKSSKIANTPTPTRITKNFPIESIDLKSKHERYYLEEFSHDFAQVILPFNPYDVNAGGYYNPARDILLTHASKEPFLLAAILAQGAKTAYTKKNLAKDEESYCKYLSRCLKLLGPALNKGQNPSQNLTSNIESVLLTVLLLTSANASNIKQDWRPHLKGAKDLLLKYTSHSNDFKESKILIFCKAWFISFELLAGLSSKKGGTLNNNELDLLMKLNDPVEIETLKEFGFVSDNGFNFIIGFHHHMLPTIKDLIKFLNYTRDPKMTRPFEVFQMIDMMGSFNQFSKIYFVNEKPYLTYRDLNNHVPAGLLLDIQQLPNSNAPPPFDPIFTPNGTVIVNWMDLCSQAYCLSGVLVLLTKGFDLSFDDEQVKPITESLVNLMKILKYSPKAKFLRWATLMIQWPMLMGGLNIHSPEQKLIVERFFQVVGSGSASFFIKRINKLWNKRSNPDSSDSESEADIDLVTY